MFSYAGQVFIISSATALLGSRYGGDGLQSGELVHHWRLTKVTGLNPVWGEGFLVVFVYIYCPEMSHPLSPHHLFCLNLHLHALIPCIYTFFLSFFQNWKLDSPSCPDRNLKTNRFVNFSSAFSHCGPLWSPEPHVWPHLSLCTLPLQSRRGPELIPEVSQSEPSLTLWLQYLTLLYFSISIIKLEYIWTQFVICFHAFLSKKLFFLKLEKFLWLVLLFLFYVLVSICKIFTNLLLCQLIISPMFSILLISFCLFPYSLCCIYTPAVVL